MSTRTFLAFLVFHFSALAALAFPANDSVNKINLWDTDSCMAVSDASRAKKAKIDVLFCQPGEGEWIFRKIGLGSRYRIEAKHSGQCLDVTKSRMVEGTQLIQYPCHNGNNQTFELKPVGNFYLIEAGKSGMCVKYLNWPAEVALKACDSKEIDELWSIEKLDNTIAKKSPEPVPVSKPKEPTPTPTPAPKPTAPVKKTTPELKPTGPNPEPTVPPTTGEDSSRISLDKDDSSLS